MATTEHFYTGNNSTTSFAFTFPYLSNSDVKVELDNVVKTENSSGQTNNDYTINNTNIVFNSAPGTGVAIHIYRTTNVDTAQAQYAAGSSIRAADLNNNQTQLLYSAQEAGGQLIRQTDLKDSIINSAKIVDSSIATGDLADGLITTAKLANDSVTNAKIVALSVGTRELNTSGVTTAKIAADAITGAKIADDSINSEHYVDGSIDTQHIADAQITTAKLASDAVTDLKIADNAVRTEHIHQNAVTEVKLANLSVKEAKLGNTSVATAKIQDNAVTTNKINAAAVIENRIADGAVATAKLATNAVTTAKIAGTAVTDVKLASNSVTSSKITDANVTTNKIADANVTLGKLHGDLKQTTISDSDTQLPTSGAVVDYVAAQIAPIGGLEVIATDAAFPNTQPQSGVVISIADAGGLVVNGSGTSTTGRTVGGSTVTINNIASNFNNSTVDAGVCFQVSSTGSGQVYNYHKATLKEADLLNLSNDINDFGNRYRVFAGEPTSNNDEGDLVYDTNANKIKVYDTSTSAWKEVTSTGDFKYLFLCPAGGSGAPTINGSIATYDLRESSNSGSAASVTSAAQLLVSINGVVQKANTGTSAPAEGFALVDANTIIFGANLASGDSVFIVQFGSALTITTPGDGTVSTAKIASGAVTTVKIADDAVTAAKLASDSVVSASIVDGSIVNADVNASAAIAGTKIAPIFGSQNVVTTGTLGSGDLTITSAAPTLLFTETNGDPDYKIQANAGVLKLVDTTNSADRVVVSTTGNIGIGTSSPDQKLIVADTSQHSLIRVIAKNDSEAGIDFGDPEDSDIGRIRYGHNGDYMRFYANGSERMRIDSSGRLLIGTTTEGESGADDLTISNTSADMGITLRSGTSNNGQIFFSDATSGNGEFAGYIQYAHNGNSMRFGVDGSERMRIGSSGNLHLGTTSNPLTNSAAIMNVTVPQGKDGFNIKHDSTHHCINIWRSASNGNVLNFYRGSSQGGSVGVISINSSSTNYATSSDYRLKENASAISDGITRLKTLKPYRFNFKVEPSRTVDGFFAHEVTAVPEAITGTKDEVNENNEPVYQGIDQSKLVPLLTAALQEAITKIETLETKVAALEAA